MDSEELWDLYDRNRRATGMTVKRKDAKWNIPAGLYHIVVECMVADRDNILILQRAEGKHHAGWWECTTGSIIHGETSIQGMIRELNEETGLVLRPEQIHLLRQERKDCVLRDTYVAFVDKIDIQEIVMQEEEVRNAQLISYEDYKQGIIPSDLGGFGFVPAQYTRFKEVFPEIVNRSKKFYGITKPKLPEKKTGKLVLAGNAAMPATEKAASKEEAQQPPKKEHHFSMVQSAPSFFAQPSAVIFDGTEKFQMPEENVFPELTEDDDII